MSSCLIFEVTKLQEGQGKEFKGNFDIGDEEFMKELGRKLEFWILNF